MNDTPNIAPFDPSTLTPLQARFAEEYLVDLNAGQAAKRAGSKAEDIYVAGHEFLRNPQVAAYIEHLQSKRREKRGIDAQWLLDRLADEAEADIADLYDEDGTLKPIHLWPKVWRTGLIAGIVNDITYKRTPEGDVIDIGRIAKIRTADRSKIKEMLGRHIGVQAFREQVGLSNPTGGPIEVAVSARSRIADRLDALNHAPPVAEPPKSDD